MSPAAGSVPGRRRLRLSGRLALRLGILALAVTAVTAWTALALVQRTFERELEGDLREAETQLDRAIEQRRRELSTALGRLADHLRVREPALLEAFLLERPEARAAVGRLMALAPLERLDLLDGDGKLLASGSNPELSGMQAPSLLDLPVGQPLPRVFEDSDGSRVAAWAARTTLRIGARELILVGGTRLDADLLADLPSVDAAALFVDSLEPQHDARGAALVSRAVRARLDATAGAAPITLQDDRDGRWLAKTVELTPASASFRGAIALAVDRGRLDRLLGRLRLAFLLLAAVYGSLAALAGVWLGRSLTRPVASLVRKVDAIAAGEEDYGFPNPGGDEFEELVASFSRLHRSLELQRNRSAAAERVAAWREVARHVAHEVKNPLVPIRLTVENLLRAREQGPERFESIFSEGMGTILEEVDQLTRMVAEFSEFARLPLPRVRTADLHAVIDAVIDLYSAEPGLTVEREYAPALPGLPVDVDQIGRALKNVVGNAVEAMREAGAEQAPKRLHVRTSMEDEMAHIEVRDSGPGLTEEATSRLFQPYFTTKARGSGLGMAITYRIVAEHGGVISARNCSPSGAVVEIRLPLVPRAAEPAHAVEGAHA